MLNHTNEGTGITGAMILELCQSHELVRYAIPEGFELLLPRFQMETKSVMDGSKVNEIHRWVVDCWWRSVEKGTLGYFVKIDLLAKSVREFRELPGDVTVSGMTISDTEMAYLDQGTAAWQARNESKETADVLDELWKSLVPDNLREYALQKKEERTVGSYLLPVESLTCWNWEMLRDMLLKRESTTIERMLDYIEYKKSGSDKRYIAPEQRAEAKARGIKLDNLELKNSRGYLAVTQDGDGNLLEKRYGLDSGTLICTPSKNGNCYQIDTAVADCSVDHDEFLEIWRSSRPDRAMRTVITLEYETDFAYIILHHQRI